MPHHPIVFAYGLEAFLWKAFIIAKYSKNVCKNKL